MVRDECSSEFEISGWAIVLCQQKLINEEKSGE